jgi:NhaP-type Na+/H+ or K+/H+ antiporter
VTELADYGLVVLVGSAVFAFAILSNKLSERFAVPAPAIFLVAAALAGRLFTRLGNELSIRDVERIAVIALIAILFDGGMLVGWRRFRAAAVPIASLGIIGTVATAAALAVLAHAIFDFGWATAGVLGAAVGPAAGGLLTDLLSWEAMFALQVPVALAALPGALRAPAAVAQRGPHTGRRAGLAALAALALASAALAAALFLLVSMVIEGWRHSPAQAAAIVTVMPVSALLAPLLARAVGAADAVPRTAAGALLLAGGLAALGLLVDAGDAVRLTPRGRLVANEALLRFLPDPG